jgi:hypothetical protein
MQIDNKKLKRYLKYQNMLNYHTQEPDDFFGIISLELYLKDILKSIIGIGLKYMPQKRINLVPVDILVLDPWEPQVGRIKEFVEFLEKEFSVKHVYQELGLKILLKGMVQKVKGKISFRFMLDACYSNYLVNKYSPKIFITFDNGGIRPSFIRYFIKNTGKLINISHSITANNYSHSTFDFHYYFIYGKSSIVNLNANKVRIGSTKAIKSGSPFIPPDFCLPPNFSKEKILFTSIWTEKSNINWHRKNLEIIKEWIQEHIEYKLFIKLHPIENPSLINSMFGEISNVEILDRSISLKDALKEVSLVVSSWSNATIEAAVLNRPSIVIDYSDLRDNNLRIEEYFLPRAKNPEELQNRIDTIFTNYESYLNSCKAYAQYHLEYTTHSLSYMSSCLKSIIEGREDFPYSFVEEDLSVLLGSKLVDCK